MSIIVDSTEHELKVRTELAEIRKALHLIILMLSEAYDLDIDLIEIEDK